MFLHIYWIPKYYRILYNKKENLTANYLFILHEMWVLKLLRLLIL